ncbi:MAG: DUF4332 domain-containing protein [Candidatus Sericytochromatia bacterium]|nr:DUF4332 domain-containing protein [Candidatus Sericytochromatia bacterium]
MFLRHAQIVLAACTFLSACGQNPSPAPAVGPSLNTLAAPLEAESAESDIKTDKAALYRTVEILGIGPVYSTALGKAGIKNVMQLLEQGHTRTGRDRIARATGISTKRLLTWVNHADLMRMTRTGPVYARLLEEAGVDTVTELSRRDAHNLRQALERAHIKGGYALADRVPSVATLSLWISRARNLGRYVEY